MMCLEQIDLFTAILIWQFKPKVNDILSITVTVFPYIHSFHYITSSISIQKLLLHVVCMQCKNTKPISKHLNFFFSEKLRRSRLALRFALSVLNIYYTHNHDDGLPIIVIYLSLTNDLMVMYIKKNPGLFSILTLIWIANTKERHSKRKNDYLPMLRLTFYSWVIKPSLNQVLYRAKNTNWNILNVNKCHK